MACGDPRRTPHPLIAAGAVSTPAVRTCHSSTIAAHSPSAHRRRRWLPFNRVLCCRLEYATVVAIDLSPCAARIGSYLNRRMKSCSVGLHRYCAAQAAIATVANDDFAICTAMVPTLARARDSVPPGAIYIQPRTTSNIAATIAAA